MDNLDIDELYEILYCVNKESRCLGEFTTPTQFTQDVMTILDSAEKKIRETIVWKKLRNEPARKRQTHQQRTK